MTVFSARQDGADIARMRFPDRVHLLGPWLLEGTLNMVHAKRGIAKTWFALAVAEAVASGNEFLGWKSEQPTKIVYFDGEMGYRNLVPRINLLASMNEKSFEPHMINFVTLENCKDGVIWNLSDPDEQKFYDHESRDAPLIIVDNLVTCIRPLSFRENDEIAWARVQKWALKKRTEGKTILFVQHSGKSGAQRGTSKVEDALDHVINLRRAVDYKPEDGVKFELHFEKTRQITNPSDAEPLLVTLKTFGDTGEWTFTSLNSEKRREAKELKARGVSNRDIAEALGVDLHTVLNWLK